MTAIARLAPSGSTIGRRSARPTAPRRGSPTATRSRSAAGRDGSRTSRSARPATLGAWPQATLRQLGENGGSRRPATNASSMSRPERPDTSVATLDNLTPASWRTLSSRCASRARSSILALRNRVRSRSSRICRGRHETGSHDDPRPARRPADGRTNIVRPVGGRAMTRDRSATSHRTGEPNPSEAPNR